MSKGKLKRKAIERPRFPEDEAKYDWLPMLLDAYYQEDSGTLKEIQIEKKKRSAKLACRKGCYNCCVKLDVPISEIEIIGLSWYACEKVKGPLREKLKKQLSNYSEVTHCFFLVDEVCSIYPMRPIACREFFVFGRPCEPNEDVLLTRPKDIWAPSRKVAKKVAFKMLSYYGYTDKMTKERVYESGFLHSNTKPMHSCDWNIIYVGMNTFDNKLSSS